MDAIEIIKKFGGPRRFAELTGMNISTARWWAYQQKPFPSPRQRGVLVAAQKNGIDLVADDLLGAVK